ncbi:phosphoribosylpyrophosphate synthetase [Flavobacterium silvisoli]|uniref:Phosphoribosylpyrophosphate synthetase n=2 Tax=Flavobacterium silvisoli TaxID=2529433 RepID=A0A4Q9Z857_9FLAO|nr:phosphoribosylpyrophosphate synthetase [Flavobacterium silvisoli]
MTTLTEVLEILKKEGYTTDFNLKSSCLACVENNLQINPEDFVVDRHYRFEAGNDPGDEAILYAISSEKYNLKGTLINGYGIYSDDISNEMMRALQPKQH